MSLLQKLDYGINDLLKSQNKNQEHLNDNIFLAGAGISMEPPSNLSSARQIMDAILRFISPDEIAYNKLKNISALRYEYIIQFFRDHIDEGLKFLDYFECPKEPNIIHKFLAEQMKKGDHVMTTNFDYLIEYAFGVEGPNLRVVISENDFRECSEPDKLYHDGTVPLYKLHGSKKNIKTGEDTKKWVVSTLDALGKQKKGKDELFTVPIYQQDLFKNISKNKTLIILGYSGGDDFDIMPALRIMRGLRQIIWVEHIQNKNNKEGLGLYKMGLLRPNDTDEPEKLINRDKFLQQIINEKQNIDVYILKGNTAKIICELASWNYIPPEKVNAPAILSIGDFLHNNFSSPPQLDKVFYAGTIFYNYRLYNEALTYWKALLRTLDDKDKEDSGSGLSRTKKEVSFKASVLGSMGNIYYEMGELDNALDFYNQAYKFHEQNGYKKDMAADLRNMGLIYEIKGDSKKASELYLEAYTIYSQLENYKDTAKDQANLGVIYRQKGEPYKALELFLKAYISFKELGDLANMASVLENLGRIYQQMGDLYKALERFDRAYSIHEQLKNKKNMADQSVFMANIYFQVGDLERALILYQRAYEIDKQLGNKQGIASDLGNMGNVYAQYGESEKAIELYQEAYNIAEKLYDKKGMATWLGNMGTLYNQMMKYDLAMSYYKKAYDLLPNVPITYNMACIHAILNQPEKAIAFLKDAIKQDANYLELAKNDPDFENIQHLEAFRRLIWP
ncbi:MAG: tetratricopeptide repeat protein [Promethearchaeota archaeon]